MRTTALLAAVLILLVNARSFPAGFSTGSACACEGVGCCAAVVSCCEVEESGPRWAAGCACGHHEDGAAHASRDLAFVPLSAGAAPRAASEVGDLHPALRLEGRAPAPEPPPPRAGRSS